MLARRLSTASYQTWIQSLSLEALHDGVVVLSAESTFNRDWVLKHYKKALCQAFSAVLGHEPRSLTITVRQPQQLQLVMAADADDAPTPETAPQRQTHEKKAEPRTAGQLNPRYRFDTFVTGPANEFAAAAARAVCQSPGTRFNPLYLHGGVGLGKTHLLQAIGHALSEDRARVVRYITSERFTAELVAALNAKSLKAFKDRYRRVDVLLIDDVQFFAGKEFTQEELFHTFNALQEAGAQIVLAGDRAPHELTRLEERLKSRFESGLMVDLRQPDYETRLGILQSRVQQQGLELADTVLEALAEKCQGNIRTLEGALNKLAAYQMLTQTRVMPDQLASVLYQSAGFQQAMATPRVGVSSPAELIDIVANYYHCDVVTMKGPSRSQKVSLARQVAFYLLREHLKLSHARIGSLAGNRSHATVLHAVRKITRERAQHPVLARQLNELDKLISSQ